MTANGVSSAVDCWVSGTKYLTGDSDRRSDICGEWGSGRNRRVMKPAPETPVSNIQVHASLLLAARSASNSSNRAFSTHEEKFRQPQRRGFFSLNQIPLFSEALRYEQANLDTYQTHRPMRDELPPLPGLWSRQGPLSGLPRGRQPQTPVLRDLQDENMRRDESW